MGSGPRLCVCAWADSEGGHGVWTPPLKNHKTIGFSSNTGIDLQKKKHKVTKPALNVGPSLVRQSLPSSTKKKAKKKRCQSRTPSGKTFWIRAKCANSPEPSLRSDL